MKGGNIKIYNLPIIILNRGEDEAVSILKKK
jgi:hypothetical protein